MKKILVLHNIRSAQNVGAMFRTADAIGIDEIICSGYTPQPLDRFGRVDKKVSKAALGAEQSVSWRHVADLSNEIAALQNTGVQVAAVEQSSTSIDYKKYNPQNDVALVMGNEVTGVEKEILELADVVLEVPMRGRKESLNVATTAGIVLFRIFDR